MTFEEPLGLLIFAFVPLFLAVLNRVLRRRQITAASFHILAEVIDSLPRLPRSFLLRKRIQQILLLTAVVLLALSAGGLVVGAHSEGPVKVVIVLDHLSNWRDDLDGPAGWEGVTATARAVCRALRKDDKVLVVRSDRDARQGGFLSPRKASSLISSMSPSSLPFHSRRILDRLRLLGSVYDPGAFVVITPFPSRWEEMTIQGGPSLRIVQAPPPPRRANLAILNVDIRPNLLSPRELSVFCRIGAFAPPGIEEAVEATLWVGVDDEKVYEQNFLLEPGVSRGITLPRTGFKEGVLTLKVLPPDHFPDDNVYLYPVRARPFLTAGLLTPGNESLEAALGALPGLTLLEDGPSGEGAGASPDLLVIDSIVPEGVSGNVLFIRPSQSLPGLRVRGTTSDLKVIEVESGHPVLEEVSFASLRIDRLPIFDPSPSLEVLARADGYPILLAGRDGHGRRMAVMGFDPFISGWTQDPSFPILVANLISWLGVEAGGISSSFLVGDLLPPALLPLKAHLAGPGGWVWSGRDADAGAVVLPLSGRYLLKDPEPGVERVVYTNLLDEEVSSAMTSFGSSPGASDIHDFMTLPFRWELRVPLLLLSLLVLSLAMLVAPTPRAGRIEQ